MLSHALIDPLVMTTEQGNTRLLRKFTGNLLIKEAALWCQENNWATLVYCFNSGKNWLRFHDHTGTTTVWIVIDDMMFIGGHIPNIMQGNTEQFALLCPFENALSEWPLEHGWKERKNVKMHKSTPFITRP